MTTNNAPSLRFLVAMVVLIPVLAIAALLLWIGNSTARRLSDQLGDRMLQDATRSVGDQVKGFLTDPVRTGDIFARRVEQGSLSVDRMGEWQSPMLDIMITNTEIAAITLGKPNDDSVYVQRVPGQIEACEAYGNESIDNQYVIDTNGNRLGAPNRTYDYRPTTRPWYQIAVNESSPKWTQIYTWFAQDNTDATMGTAYVIKTVDAQGNFNGVMCIDVTLDGLSVFLKSIVPNQSSVLILIDDEKKLVAASKGNMTRNGERTTLAGSNDPLVASIGHALNIGGQANTMIPDHRLLINSEYYRVRIEKIAPYPGIDWQVIAAIPERELLAEARDTQQRSILLAFIVAGGGVVLAIAQAGRIARPIVAVQQHTAKIAQGDFESEIKVKGAQELIALSDNLNQMSRDLKNRIEMMQSLRIATQVQQSLLPKSDPKLTGLDIHGTSKYCDQTGGDYYDFIELGASPTGELLIAVGDVMGHGIGSAMLMSSARGALRASLLDNASAADVLARVNRVLAQSDAGMFMTMTLMRLNAREGTAVWASGGHDPAIVYDPQKDSFRELEGAEPPLGLVADMEFGLYRADNLHAPLILIIGTDGIWESRNESEEFYGKERMMEVIRKYATRSAKDIGDMLEADLIQFRGKSPILDDVTFVIVKLLPT